MMRCAFATSASAECALLPWGAQRPQYSAE
jgi:hypothetical protein